MEDAARDGDETAIELRSSLSYLLICLIDALFRELRCAELLRGQPAAAPKLLETITGILATMAEENGNAVPWSCWQSSRGRCERSSAPPAWGSVRGP